MKGRLLAFCYPIAHPPIPLKACSMLASPFSVLDGGYTPLPSCICKDQQAPGKKSHPRVNHSADSPLKTKISLSGSFIALLPANHMWSITWMIMMISLMFTRPSPCLFGPLITICSLRSPSQHSEETTKVHSNSRITSTMKASAAISCMATREFGTVGHCTVLRIG